MAPRVLLLLVIFTALAACGPAAPEPEPAPRTVRKTYKVISGISMGAIGASTIAAAAPDRFDAVVTLGGPLDAAYLLRMLDRMHTGGTCPLETLESMLATNPASLNDPALIDACAVKSPLKPYELSADTNHWIWTTGGAFDRSGHLRLFHDLTLAFGNLFTENRFSAFAPIGIAEQRVLAAPSTFCTEPVRISGIYNREYNPEGKYDVITFCDGSRRIYYCLNDKQPVDFCADPANVVTPLPAAQEAAFAASQCAGRGGHAIATRDALPELFVTHAGRFDACRSRTEPVTVALAIDLNGNGIRDYGEPMLNNGQERFADVGVDGCGNTFEDGNGGCLAAATGAAGDPNGDDFDPVANALGTEGDGRWTTGEPFDDLGLDGVADTFDFGEGNGSYDLSIGRRRMFERDPRSRFSAMPEEQLGRLRFFLDGGVRDLFNFGVASQHLFGAIKARHPGSSELYRRYVDIPGLSTASGRYDPWLGAWTKPPQNFLVLFGKDDPTLKEELEGDGDHVGTVTQAVDRLATLATFAGAQWRHLEKPKGLSGGATYAERNFITSFVSEALGAPREFGVFLPPGYDAPENAEVRYPVLFMLHGYGQGPADFLATSLFLDGQMSGNAPALRPMIVVYPSGRCCYSHRDTGARDCREKNDDGVAFAQATSWKRECSSGTFFVDHAGGSAYAKAFDELVAEVDRRYRTLPVEDLPVE